MNEINVVPARDTETLRSKIKDALAQPFENCAKYDAQAGKYFIETDFCDIIAHFADATFDALGITPDQQDIEGAIVTVSVPQEIRGAIPNALLQKVLGLLKSAPRFKRLVGAETYTYVDSFELAKEIENAIVATQKIKIEIRGGVADVIEKPTGIEVEIFDHDNERVETGSGKFIYNTDIIIK